MNKKRVFRCSVCDPRDPCILAFEMSDVPPNRCPLYKDYIAEWKEDEDEKEVIIK